VAYDASDVVDHKLELLDDFTPLDITSPIIDLVSNKQKLNTHSPQQQIITRVSCIANADFGTATPVLTNNYRISHQNEGKRHSAGHLGRLTHDMFLHFTCS
jgi:hypothetical protein